MNIYRDDQVLLMLKRSLHVHIHVHVYVHVHVHVDMASFNMIILFAKNNMFITHQVTL